MTRKLIFLIALVLVLSVLGACSNKDDHNSNNAANTTNNDEKLPENFNPTGFPVVNEKISLKVAGNAHPNNTKSDWNEKYIFKLLEEQTNVHVEWEVSPKAGWLEKRNLMLASGDLPDVILNVGLTGGGSDGELVQYGSQGIYIPLNDLIEQYAPNLQRLFEQRPHIKEQITAPDGNIYSIPRLYETGQEYIQDILWINKTWLDQLNLSVPETTEEFADALRAFKADDPNGNGKNDEIPFTFIYEGTKIYGLNGFMGAFGIPNYEDYLSIRDDKVIYNAIQPEFKTGINYLHTLYSQGLIDPEAFTQDQTQLNGTMSGEEMLVGSFIGYAPNTISNEQRWKEGNYIPLILNGPDGKKLWSGYPAVASAGGMVITAANEHPEVTMRWIDHTFEEYFSFQMTNGPISDKDEPHVRWLLHPDGTLEELVKNRPEGMNNGQWRYLDSGGNDIPYAVLGEMEARKVVDPNAYKGYNGMNRVEFNKYVMDNNILQFVGYPPLMHTKEQTEKLAQFQTDIGEYTKRSIAKWITQGGIDAGWDDYLNQMKKIGLEEMLSILQESYDRE